MRIELNTNINAETGMLPQLMGRIKLTNFITMPESEFYKIIKEVENTEIFKKLTYPEDRNNKIISYKRYPSASFNRQLYEFKEEIISEVKRPGVEKLLCENEEIVKTIRLIGYENFRKYFLSCEEEAGINQIADNCCITVKEARNIIGLVNSVYVQEEFSNPGLPQTKPGNRDDSQFTCVARINLLPVSAGIKKGTAEKKETEIEFFNLNYFRGRYSINYKKLSDIKKKGAFDKKELKITDKLIKQLELINARKTILYQIIMKIANKQKKYFETGRYKDMKLFTQRMLAAELGVSTGSISRVLNNKSIEASWSEQRPLRFFLPNIKQLRKEVIKDIFLNNKSKSDRIIAEDIEKQHGFKMARRTICQYRGELGGAQ